MNLIRAAVHRKVRESENPSADEMTYFSVGRDLSARRACVTVVGLGVEIYADPSSLNDTEYSDGETVFV